MIALLLAYVSVVYLLIIFTLAEFGKELWRDIRPDFKSNGMCFLHLSVDLIAAPVWLPIYALRKFFIWCKK